MGTAHTIVCSVKTTEMLYISYTIGCRAYKQSLDNVTLPTSLEDVTFGHAFEQCVRKVVWPQSLCTLTFGFHFNQCMDHISLREGLHAMTFGYDFQCGMDHVLWPKGCQSLRLSIIFRQPDECDCSPWSRHHRVGSSLCW